jgi:hypothetical protein
MAYTPASINNIPQLKDRYFNLILRMFAAVALSRLRRKSVKKTKGVSVKKFSLFDDQREEFGKF